MEKAIFKATRKDAVHPKQKHVDTLIQMTWSGVSMEELFMLVQDRFSEANWVISFKALIVVHILMHESNGPMIYDYLIHHPNALDMTRFRDRHGTKGVSAFEQSKNVRTYASYLNDKVLAFKAIRIDHVSSKQPKGSQIYAKQTADIKFLLLEVSTVQKQLHSVLKNRFDSDTFDNETTFSAFRYCLRDMLKLFQVMNLGVMKMLKIYFEINEEDMRRALDLYKRFVKLTDRADEYLKIARRFENIFGFSIPNLTHAPLSLSKALEDFLEMPAEERMATVGEMKKSAKKPGTPVNANSNSSNSSNTNNSAGNGSVSKRSNAAKSKPDYGLKLKPDLLGDGSGTVRSTASTPTSAVRSNSQRPGAAPSQAKAARAKTPTSATSAPPPAARSSTSIDNTKAKANNATTAAEKDFIDFFSSIDDEPVTPATPATAQTAGAPTDSNQLMMLMMAGTVSDSNVAVQTQQQNSNTNDFDTMFQALSNPFAANNTGFANNSPFGVQQNDFASSTSLTPSSGTTPFGTSMQTSFSGIQTAPIQPFADFSSTPLGANSTTSLSNTPFGAVNTNSPFQTQQQQQQQQQQLLLPQQDLLMNNNPFRQTIFSTQADATAQQNTLLASQMAQMSLQPQLQQQPQQQPQQPQQQQQAAVSYNPFTQRQTMYLAESASASSPSPFASTNNAGIAGNGNANVFAQNSINNSVPSPFGAFNNGNLSQPQQQQQQQQSSGGAASNLQQSINNGNFANFDFFS
ncbi:hypothetical protein GGI12_003138 [Dipsacomyces acuminosporus]|nr:hypothetical protein GGI12_003138 [Dipsacomyces acuminosporus]